MKTTEYEGKQIKIIDASDFTYNDVAIEKIAELNPELTKILLAHVKHYLANEEKILAEEKVKADIEKIKTQTKEVEEFKKVVEPLWVHKGYDMRFSTPNANTWNFDAQYVSISKGSVDGDISYDSQVYGASSYRSHKTNKPWVLHFNYKRIRYGKLETALAKLREKIDDKIVARKYTENEEQKKLNQEDVMKKFAEENDFKFEKVYHSSRNRRSYSGYYTFVMKKDNVTANITFDEETNSVKIHGYTVRKDNITVEDLNSIR